MEEVKEKTVITGEEKKGPTYQQYRQLKDWCDQLLMQRNQIAEKLNQVTDVINKLPWLFKVIENRSVFESEFVNECVKEIVFIMTPSTEGLEEESKKESNKELKA